MEKNKRWRFPFLFHHSSFHWNYLPALLSWTSIFTLGFYRGKTCCDTFLICVR